MKKLIGKAMLVAAVSLCFALVIGCKTTKSAEEQFKALYDRYYSDLILDDAKTYTVVSGDYLAEIARNSEYHNALYYPIIMLASKDVVQDPDKIEPGMELTVPDLQKNLDDPKARANIKKFLVEVAKVEDSRNRTETADGLRKLSDSM